MDKKEAKMNTKTQLRGNCQICGRQQAVRGTVAKHGYTVDFGYFNGVCSGQYHKPLQEDRSALDATIVQVEADIATKQALVEDYKSGKKHPKQVRLSTRRMNDPEYISWDEANEWQKRDGVNSAVYGLESMIRGAQGWIKGMTELAEKVHGQPLIENVQVAKPQIEVGSTIKLFGREMVVTKIEYDTARGVGPGINGQCVEHVFWMDGDKEKRYPKRYARLVA